jgi:hypothetical protein
MSPSSYPQPCPSCKKNLFGPVSYCPFCGKKHAVLLRKEEPKIVEDVGHVEPPPPLPPPEDEPKVIPTITPPPDPAPHSTTPEPGTSKKSTDPHKAPEITIPSDPEINKTKKKKWPLILLALISALIVFWVLGQSPEKPVPPLETGRQQKEVKPAPISTPPPLSTPNQCATVRTLASECQTHGTDLSKIITKLPKHEKTLAAAKKLVEISPRYQEQFSSAEKTFNDARDNRDKHLMAYMGKLFELSRHSPKDLDCAMKLIQSGDLTPREKMVTDMLFNHVKLIQKTPKVEPSTLLENFVEKFEQFID